MGLEAWQKEGIEQMSRDGKSQRDISASLGISKQTVNKYCQRFKKQAETRKKRRDSLPAIPWKIDLSKAPTEQSIQTDILTLYRQSLQELSVRLPEMSTNEVYTLSMTLLNAINNNNVES